MRDGQGVEFMSSNIELQEQAMRWRHDNHDVISIDQHLAPQQYQQ